MSFYGVFSCDKSILIFLFLIKHVQLTDETTPANFEMVDVMTKVLGQDKGKNQLVDPKDDLLYDPVKGVTKKKEIWTRRHS
jgi:hypothetical protein